MAKRRRIPKKKTKERGLFGVPVETTNKVKDSLIEGGLTLASAVAGGGAGAAIGKHSLLTGIPIIIFGVYKKNKYIAAAGLGMCLANGFQPKTDTQTSGTDEEVDGFDMEQVKNRVGTYFKNFSEKLYLPKAKTEEGVNGLSGDDRPSYFINPYNQQIEGPVVDMSQLDRVQQDIANMGGINDTDRIL